MEGLIKIKTSLHFGLVEGKLKIETHYWDSHGIDSCYYFSRNNIEIIFSKNNSDKIYIWINRGKDYDELIELLEENYDEIYNYYERIEENEN